MIRAFVKTKPDSDKVYVIELPADRYALYAARQNKEIDFDPNNLMLHPTNDGQPEVTLVGESELDKDIIAMAGKYDTLFTVSRAAELVRNASEHIIPDLYKQIANDDFGSYSELEAGIRGLTWSAGEDTISFYYPLIGQVFELDDGYGYTEPEQVGAQFLAYYEDSIREALECEQDADTQNMVSYMDCGEELSDKLIAMNWDVEIIGTKLYGRTDVRIAEDLTPEEINEVKSYIRGQNSDGLGEGFEQRPLGIGEGELYVSMWNSGGDYFVCTEDELQDHIEQSSGQDFGSM